MTERLDDIERGNWCEPCGHEGPCHPEQAAELRELRAQNAALVAAGNMLSTCYEVCLCPSDNGQLDCYGWPMLWDALASVKGAVDA